MGTICVIATGDREIGKEVERGYTIVGAGHMSGKLALMVEHISHHTPIVCIEHMNFTGEVAMAATIGERHPPVILVAGHNQVADQIPNRKDFAQFLFQKTAFEFETLILTNKEMLEHEDYSCEEEDEFGYDECYFVYPSIISISRRWFNYLSGVPP